MGSERINQVIEALREAGFRAERGYPSRKMPDPASAVVAVCLAEQTREKAAVRVMVYCGGDLGGAVCEDQALLVAAVLKGMGGNCSVGGCEFHSKTGLFCVEVTAAWPQIPPVTVLVGETALPYVTAVTAKQSWVDVFSADGTSTSLKKGWSIFVEEMLPPGSFLMEKDTVGFAITLLHETGSETYDNCYWDSVTSQVSIDGVYRKREAWTWSEPTLTQTEG